jgi:putative addiction module antidote
MPRTLDRSRIKRIYRYISTEAAMIETRIRRVGNSAVMTLTTEMLTILDAKEGDTLFVLRGDDGSLRIMAHDPSVAEALEAAEIVMDENRDLLQALA